MAVRLSSLQGKEGRTEPLFEYTSGGMRVVGSSAAYGLFSNAPSSIGLQELGRRLFSYSQALVFTARSVEHLRVRESKSLEASMREFLRDGVMLVSDRFASEQGILADSDIGTYVDSTSYIRAQQTADMILETHTHEGGHAIVDLLGLDHDEVIGEMFPIALERKHHGRHARYRDHPHKAAERLVSRLERACGRRATLPQLWGVLQRYQDSRVLSRDLSSGRIRTV